MKTLLSWSSGKDSAWALYKLRQDPVLNVVGLFTTINEAFDRVAMHGVRRAIVEAQAGAVGLPLSIIPLPWPCSNEIYAERMGTFVREQISKGVEAMAFGDLFLEDIRRYREENLAGLGVTPLFPIWGVPTDQLARDMIQCGLVTHVATVDTRRLAPSFAGRTFDAAFLDDLPEGIDPCGENGEFHTCVSDGPMFARPVAVRRGEVVTREGFAYADFELAV